LIGYDLDAPNVPYLLRNSWGPNWGDGGFCGVPEDYFFNGKCILEAYAFTKLPVPFIPVPEYVPEDPATFYPDTQLLTIPSIAFNGLNIGNGMLYGVTIKLKNYAKLTVNDPNWPGSETAYYLPSVNKKHYLGFPKVLFNGQVFENVVLLDPDFDLVSVAGA